MPTTVCIHLLQDLPPANLNRDDNGTPKTAAYGGVDRLRVSSQAWKRATRKHFETSLSRSEVGVRTRRVHGLLASLLKERGSAPDVAAALADGALSKVGIKDAKKTQDAKKKAGAKKDTVAEGPVLSEDKGDDDEGGEAKKDTVAEGPVLSSYLLFVGRSQLEQLADELHSAEDPSVVPVADILGSAHTLDVALFGRMVADMTALNVDAAAQVAHALSTHAAPTQFDYFTAVDDEQQADEAGAGMIGLVEFSSGTLYRYAAVSLDQLVANMGYSEAAVKGVGQFLRSFVEALPTGKQNTFADHTRPALVLVEVRTDHPVSLVSAFESPVRSQGSGFVAPSQIALAAHHKAEWERWGDKPALRIASYSATGAAEKALQGAYGASVSVDHLVARVEEVLTDQVRSSS
ncbi:MAG: type I-E CRISPR-associated protein Cas7/Cse4/CasC [Tetrasphaera sp.]|nr:type I-E CRISPR-associated protein Cas7/Cse4/CasC [Tetrasphaera sp.]